MIKSYAFKKWIKKPVLFSQFLPINYVASTGSSEYDTGIQASSIKRFIVNGYCAPNTGSNAQLIGTNKSGAATFYGARLQSSDKNWYAMDADGNGLVPSAHWAETDVTINSMTSQTGTIKDLDTGEVKTVSKISTSDWDFGSGTLKLFGGASETPDRISPDAKCRHLVLYNDNGVCLLDAIAVKDVVNNTVGFYDRVTETYTAVANASAGDEIKPVSYLESTGTQYIDTGVVPNTLTDRIVADVQFLGETTAYRLYGRRQSAKGLGFGLNNSNKFMCSAHGDVATNVSHTTDERNVYDVDAKNSTFKVYRGNDVIATTPISCASSDITQTETLFAMAASAGGVVYNSNSRCYSYKHYNGDGVLVRDMIPIKVGTEYCMLDLINFQIYSNQGSGAFSGGAELPPILEEQWYLPKKDNQFYIIKKEV